jgi:hypothetical protein
MKAPHGFSAVYRRQQAEGDLHYFRRCEKASVKGILALFGLMFIAGMNFRQMGTAGMIAATIILFVLAAWTIILAIWNDYAARMTDIAIGFRDQDAEGNKSEQASPANRHPSGTSGMAPANPASRAGAMPEAIGDS